MGNRSYIILEASGEASILLEANNLLPLLWLAALPPSQLGSIAFLPTGSIGIEDRAPLGFSLGPDEATDQLMRRRAFIETWFGTAGGIIVDQFAELLTSDRPERIHLDLTEQIDLFDSRDDFLTMLQRALAVLDSDPSKGSPRRRPPAVKWLMDEFSLSGVAESAPLFGLALAGGMNNDGEPWLRVPPRPERKAGEKLYPSNEAHHIANNGRVIVAGLRNDQQLRTPVIWNLALGTTQLLNVPDNVGHVFVHHVSHDGKVLVGGCTTHPSKRYELFRYADGQLTLLGTDHERVFLASDMSADASVIVGTHMSTDPDYEIYNLTKRAFRMDGCNTPVDIGPPGVTSSASVLTPDGRHAGGYTEQGTREAREHRAFLWSAQDGCVDLGQGFFMVDWVAISADGQRGLLKYMTQYGGPTGYQFWQRGQALRDIPELLDARAVRISAAVDAVVANTSSCESPSLWTCNGGMRPLDLSAATGKTEALWVGDGGNAVVVVESAPGAYWGCENILVWKDGLVERHAVYNQSGGDILGLRYANRSPALVDFVASGELLRKGAFFSWSLESGLQPLPECSA